MIRMAIAGAAAAFWLMLGVCWAVQNQAPQEQQAAPSAQAAPAVPAEPGITVDPNRFKLGPEDVIAVRVWREPDLSGVVAVSPDGHISLPLINEVQVSGLTSTQVSKLLSEMFAKFVNNPQVTVSIQAVRSKRYTISGEVNRPGAYPLAVQTTVFQALTAAGGFREFANKKKIIIVRGEQRLRFNYNEVVKGKNLAQNIELETGDQIIVN
jgi:polysaccharide biosynthesis/export protein